MTSNFLASVDAKGKTFEVEIRPDGFFNATKMCKTSGKAWKGYERNRTTKEFLNELSSDLKVPVTDLIDSKNGGNDHYGTWVHQLVSPCLGSPYSFLVVRRREWEFAFRLFACRGAVLAVPG